MPEDCKHERFTASCNVGRLTETEEPGSPVKDFVMEVTVCCDDCKEPFEFIGASAGYAFDKPTCSVDFTTVNLPIRPATGKLATKSSYQLSRPEIESPNTVN